MLYSNTCRPGKALLKELSIGIQIPFTPGWLCPFRFIMAVCSRFDAQSYNSFIYLRGQYLENLINNKYQFKNKHNSDLTSFWPLLLFTEK